eukprot:s5107_g2.t3
MRAFRQLSLSTNSVSAAVQYPHRSLQPHTVQAMAPQNRPGCLVGSLDRPRGRPRGRRAGSAGWPAENHRRREEPLADLYDGLGGFLPALLLMRSRGPPLREFRFQQLAEPIGSVTSGFVAEVAEAVRRILAGGPLRTIDDEMNLLQVFKADLYLADNWAAAVWLERAGRVVSGGGFLSALPKRAGGRLETIDDHCTLLEVFQLAFEDFMSPSLSDGRGLDFGVGRLSLSAPLRSIGSWNFGLWSFLHPC